MDINENIEGTRVKTEIRPEVIAMICIILSVMAFYTITNYKIIFLNNSPPQSFNVKNTAEWKLMKSGRILNIKFNRPNHCDMWEICPEGCTKHGGYNYASFSIGYGIPFGSMVDQEKIRMGQEGKLYKYIKNGDRKNKVSWFYWVPDN